jgi:ribulose 1,5-bisphosphate synthetase/thiazole synthase
MIFEALLNIGVFDSFESPDSIVMVMALNVTYHHFISPMEKTIEVDTVVIGLGPTGIGAATRLNYHKQSSWLVVEATPAPGVWRVSLKTLAFE